MFTIKFYSCDGYRQIIKEAESFTILRGDGEAEITLHQKLPHEDRRYDIKDDKELPATDYRPPRFGKAIIENASGRTTEIIVLGPSNGAARNTPQRTSKTIAELEAILREPDVPCQIMPDGSIKTNEELQAGFGELRSNSTC